MIVTVPSMKKKTRPVVRARVATINALGHSHTRPGGNAKRRWLPSWVRTGILVRVILARRLSIVGLQEFQAEQQRVFTRLVAARVFGAHVVRDNAVVWLRARWKLVDAGQFEIPYFHGEMKPMPYVVLRRRGLWGRRRHVAFASTHNPASTRGDALHLRERGWAIEAQWATGMLKRPKVVAALVVGDKNSPERFYVPSVERSGGRVSGVPEIRGIDWIAGWGDVTFTRHKARYFGRIARMSDHPVVQAVARIGAKS